MTPEINNLLAFLDKTEAEQEEWCSFYTDRHTGESLAELAFRKRDEAPWEYFNQAMDIVWGYWCKKTWPARKKTGEKKQHIKRLKFWTYLAEPIHYIIAAVIAKKLGGK